MVVSPEDVVGVDAAGGVLVETCAAAGGAPLGAVVGAK